jgi:hypothetical protein
MAYEEGTSMMKKETQEDFGLTSAEEIDTNWWTKPVKPAVPHHIKTALEPLAFYTQPALKTQVAGNHYKEMAIQPIEFAIKNGLNACQSKAIKYIVRNKGDKAKRIEDLKKAIHVIELYIGFIEDGTLAH